MAHQVHPPTSLTLNRTKLQRQGLYQTKTRFIKELSFAKMERFTLMGMRMITLTFTTWQPKLGARSDEIINKEMQTIIIKDDLL